MGLFVEYFDYNFNNICFMKNYLVLFCYVKYTLVIKNISRINFVRLVGDYKKGTHLSKPKFKKYLEYTRAKNVDIEFKEDACVCLDGEITYAKKLDVSIEPQKLRFLLPKGE